MPGRGECGSWVNSTPFFLRSAATASMPGDCQAEMIEPLIGRRWRRVDAITGIDLGGEDHRAAELDIDARLSEHGAADDLGTEHALKPLRGRLPDRACADGRDPR